MRLCLLFIFLFVASGHLFGQNEPDSFVVAHRSASETVRLQKFEMEDLDKPTASDVARQSLVEQGNPLFQNNKAKLLPSAREKYTDLFATIRDAHHFIHLEYFILYNDSVGSALFDILKEKVDQGVEVRVLVDAYGNHKSSSPLTKSILASIRQSGIKIAIYDPLHFPYFLNIMHRDHRKIAVIDGRVAYTGGMNIAEYYLHGKRQTGPWRDMQVRLEGPVVDEFERIFARIWQKTTGEHLDSLHYRAEHSPIANREMVVVNREPHKLSRQIRKAYASAIDAAQKEIRIVNPYPTNVRTVRQALRRALQRGVKVKLMVSSVTDNHIVPEVVGIQMRRMTRHGAEVYYFEGGFHHSKVMTVDGEFCTVGTTNLDARSMCYDYEVNVFIFDPLTTYQLNNIFDSDIAECELLTPENFKRRFSLKKRFVGQMFQVLKGFL